MTPFLDPADVSNFVEDKLSIIDAYSAALARLNREDATEKLAKAFLVVAKSLYPLGSQRALEAIESCVNVLNKLADREEPLRESEIDSAVAIGN